jgi:alkylhydroperoxidase/carboxymuconolactone decarboxylase family protein YurZ
MGGRIPVSKQLNTEQKKLKETFIKERGYWSEEIWEPLLKLDEDFFKAYLNFSAVPWKKGTLPPKIKELIYIAIDVSTTHLYKPGLKQHIRNALKYGATKEEIMEVFELVSVLGIHTCTVGVPILIEELKTVEREF